MTPEEATKLTFDANATLNDPKSRRELLEAQLLMSGASVEFRSGQVNNLESTLMIVGTELIAVPIIVTENMTSRFGLDVFGLIAKGKKAASVLIRNR